MRVAAVRCPEARARHGATLTARYNLGQDARSYGDPPQGADALARSSSVSARRWTGRPTLSNEQGSAARRCTVNGLVAMGGYAIALSTQVRQCSARHTQRRG